MDKAQNSNVTVYYYNEPAFVYLSRMFNVEAKHASLIFIDSNNTKEVLKCEMTVHLENNNLGSFFNNIFTNNHRIN